MKKVVKKRCSNMYILVQANDIKEAYDNTIAIMKNTMGDYTIPAIAESSIMDIFPYFSCEEGEMEQIEKAILNRNGFIDSL
jgi:hypothetical protein